MTTPSTDRAYVAGFFDGDGCVDVSARVGAVRVRFGQTRPYAVTFLQGIYGGAVSKRAPEGQQDVYTYALAKKDTVRTFLTDVLPYVREKRQAVLLGLELLTVPISTLRARSKEMQALRYANARDLSTLPAERVALGRPKDAWMRPRPASPEELAYVAGFFDAEGNLQPKRHPWGSWGLEIRFGQVVEDGVRLLQELYGGPVRVEKARGQRQPQCRWELTRKDAVRAFLRDVAPYVKEKEQQVRIALDVFAQETSLHTDVRGPLEHLRGLNVKARR